MALSIVTYAHESSIGDFQDLLILKELSDPNLAKVVFATYIAAVVTFDNRFCVRTDDERTETTGRTMEKAISLATCRNPNYWPLGPPDEPEEPEVTSASSYNLLWEASIRLILQDSCHQLLISDLSFVIMSVYGKVHIMIQYFADDMRAHSGVGRLSSAFLLPKQPTSDRRLINLHHANLVSVYLARFKIRRFHVSEEHGHCLARLAL